jgi:Co/Zn/Cd efflux system component
LPSSSSAGSEPDLHLRLSPAEDLAGLFIAAMIALSATVAAVESIRRFFEPQPVQNVGWSSLPALWASLVIRSNSKFSP